MAPTERTRTTAQAQAEGLRVFVAGIPWKIGEETLRRDFEECGAVEDIFILKDAEGNSRGRAFITFRDSEAVEAALKFDNTPYGGRTIFVKVADEKKKEAAADKAKAKAKDPADGRGKKAHKAGQGQAAAASSAARGGFPTEKPEGCVSLCLKNIGDATQADVRTFLEGCTVQSVRIVMDRVTGMARGIAFVDFPATGEVDKAMAHKGKKLNGSAVDMHYEAPRERPRPEGCMSVAVKKLGPHTVEKDVRKLFRGLESISEVRVICDAQRKCTGLAFVEFTSPADVEAAVRRDGMSLRGQTIFICYETKAKKERPPVAHSSAEPAGGAGKKKKKKDQPDDAEEEGDADAGGAAAAKKGKKNKKKPKPASQPEDEPSEAALAEPAADSKKKAANRRKKEAQKLKKKRKKGAEEAAEEAPKEEAPEAPGKKKRKKAGG